VQGASAPCLFVYDDPFCGFFLVPLCYHKHIGESGGKPSMDYSNIIFSVLVLFGVGYLIYSANQYDMALALMTPDSGQALATFVLQRSKVVRWMLYGVAAVNFLYAFLILLTAFLGQSSEILSEANTALPSVDTTGALVNLVLAMVVTIACVRTTRHESARRWVRSLAGHEANYNPYSGVHQVALVLALCFVSVTIGQLQLVGGLSGLAQQIESDGAALGPQVFQTVLMIVAALLGVGLVIRRDWKQTAQRLGLRLPTVSDLKWGIGIGIGLYIGQMMMVELWYFFAPPEQIAQQIAASDQIGQIFATIPLALFLASSAAVSEEILFRGALQPVFGLGLSSLFFALAHIQYSFTPVTLIIFAVSLGLGWLRNRHSTTASIIAHFTYNFIVLALAILVAGAIGGSQ
jgi:membrane protease YdiL (CAAX protease family)